MDFLEPTKCGPNQHYEKCAAKLTCQPSCHAKKRNSCYDRCEPGCVCNGKLVRNHKKECVHPKDCHRPATPRRRPPQQPPRVKYPTQQQQQRRTPTSYLDLKKKN